MNSYLAVKFGSYEEKIFFWLLITEELNNTSAQAGVMTSLWMLAQADTNYHN